MLTANSSSNIIKVQVVNGNEKTMVDNPFNLKELYREAKDADKVRIRWSISEPKGVNLSFGSKVIQFDIRPESLWHLLLLVESWLDDIDFLKAASAVSDK